MGLPAEIIAQLEQSGTQNGAPHKGFGTWPQNMAIVDAFIAVASQWRTIVLPNGRVVWQGLDYASVDIGLNRAGIALRPDQWADVQIMERAAASALNGYRD
jgi:hypothetical protein